MSVERDVQTALKLFDEAGQRPDESWLDTFAGFWARQARNLSVSHLLGVVAKRLTRRLNSNDCDPDHLALLTVADVDLLLQECRALEPDVQLAVQSAAKSNLELAVLFDASADDRNGTLWGIQDEKSFIRGLVYCLQTPGDLDVQRLSEYWSDKYSLIQHYLWARLYASSRFGKCDYALALQHFDHLSHFVDERCGAKPKLDVVKDPNARWLRDQIRVHRSNARAQHERQQMHQREAQHETEVERAREEDRRQIISFLSHTLTSATAGGSKTVRKIASKLASAQANVDLPEVAQRLAAQVSRMARVESLVEVFKLYTSDDKALREGWDRDTGGDFSVLQVCAMAIQQALLRFYFSSEHEADFSRLMPEADYTTVSQEFMTDALALDMSTPDQARQFIDWSGQRLPFLRLSFSGAEAAHLSQGGARDIVIFALTGEFLGNALKYAAAGQAITLDIRVGTTGLEIVCRNSMKAIIVAPIHGGKTGLTFIRRVCALISAEFDEPTVKDNVFILRALLPIQ